MNNGFRQKNDVSNQGDGYVRISFIGQQCCGPMDVYIAMAFIAGILAKLLFTYGIYWSFKTFRRMHTSYVIISHLKELKREAHQLETDEVYLVDRVLREQEDLKSRMGASRPDLRRRVSGRKRTRDESEYTETEYSESYSQSYSQTQTAQTSESQYSDNSQSTVIENKAPDSDESESDASTIVERTKHQSMMQSQALTNVTALSKKSLNQNEPDSILAASTAIGTLKGRAKMDAMNKSARSGIYSTIGRNAKMPEEDDDDEDGNELAEVMARRSAAASRRTLTSERDPVSQKSKTATEKTATSKSHTKYSSRNDRSRSGSRSRYSETKSSKSRSRTQSRTRSHISEDYSKSNLSISETNLSETNLSMSESQYSQSQYSNSQYSQSGSQFSQSDRSDYSKSTIQSHRRK